MTLTIHVGAHKTASTHLQQSLRSVMPQMQAAGIHYSDAAHWRGWPMRLAAALDDGPQGRRLLRRLQARFDPIDEFWPHQILSEENILGTLRPDSLIGDRVIYPQAQRRMNRLCGAFRRRPATVCLAVRDPLDFFTSAFSMRVLGGHALVWEEYLDGYDPATVSWTGLARRLLAARGVARLIVWRYEDYAALRPALLARLLPADVAAAVPDGPRAVVGLSQTAYDAFLRRAMEDVDADLAEIARAADQQYPRRDDHARLITGDAALAAACAAAYAADMDTLAALPGVEFLRP